MTPDERAQRMLEHLPRFLQSGPNIAMIFRALCEELERMEESTRRLLRARWIGLAEGFEKRDPLADKASSELGRIGALFNLHPNRGESADYFRKHLADLLRIHTRGVTTARALLSLVSFVYLAEGDPDIKWVGDVATGIYKVTDESGNKREIRVELHENPKEPASARMIASPGQNLRVYNGGLEEAFPEIEIVAPPDAGIAVPRLSQLNSGLDVVFVGRLKKNQKLLLRHGLPPLIDGVAKPDELVIVANTTRFSTHDNKRIDWCFGPTGGARFAASKKDNTLPKLRLGASYFRYEMLTSQDLSPYLPRDITDDEEKRLLSLADPKDKPADITFRWEEITPAAFDLHVLSDYVPPHYLEVAGEEGGERLISNDAPPPRDVVGGRARLVRDIEAALNYGRAAGVRARVVMKNETGA